MNVQTAKKFGKTDSEFKEWAKRTARELPEGPAKAFLHAYLNYRAGTTRESELTTAFKTLAGVESKVHVMKASGE